MSSPFSSPSASGAISADVGAFFLGAGVGTVPRKNVLVLGTLRGCEKVGGGGRAGFSFAEPGRGEVNGDCWGLGAVATLSLVVDSAVVRLPRLGTWIGRGGLILRAPKGLPRRWGINTGDPGGGAGGWRRGAFTRASGFLGTAGFSPD